MSQLYEEVPMACPEYALSPPRRATESLESDVPLEDRERVLRALMGRLPAMVYRCADDAHWTMEFVSGGSEELTGYRPEELVGNARLAYVDLVAPWHCESVCRDIQTAIDRHNAWTTTYPIITASGERKWVWERGVAVLDENGEVRALEGLIVDMTSERAIEEARESELAEWRQVFDVMDESVMVLRDDGTIVRANVGTAALTGRAPETLPGARCWEVLHGFCAPHPDCPRERALRSGSAQTSYIRQSDRLLRMSFKPTSVLGGRVSGGIHVVTDVTDLLEGPGLSDREHVHEASVRKPRRS
jgi:PAS domain S-box-containing protein